MFYLPNEAICDWSIRIQHRHGHFSSYRFDFHFYSSICLINWHNNASSKMRTVEILAKFNVRRNEITRKTVDFSSILCFQFR